MEQVPLGWLIAALAVLIILSGFFSSSETALIALNRYRMRHRAQQGHRGAKLAQRLLDQPDRLIGIILLGNNLVNILAASIATIVFLRLLGDSGVWVSTAVMTVVVLIFAEVAPKTAAAFRPERIAYPASFILYPLLRVLYPIVWLINGASNLLLGIFGIRVREGTMEQLTRDELRTLLKDSDNHISDDHQQMLLNILDLEQAVIDDVMVPRNEIVGIDLEDEWQEILSKLSQTLYTRLPVYRGDVNNMQGLLHVRTILSRLSTGRLNYDDLVRSVREPYFIPEGTPLTQQLLEFQRLERRLGLVVDEYGDIIGLITLDDILEEIVGEFTTEAKGYKKMVRRLEDGAYLIDGSANLRMLNRRYDWNLPTETGRTLNGLILERLEMIPHGQTCLRISEHILTIVEIKDNVIRKVLLKPYRFTSSGNETD
ncbi:MAG: HlyC/CorC family transporter [Wenzhouxiangellaceae bacterium]